MRTVDLSTMLLRSLRPLMDPPTRGQNPILLLMRGLSAQGLYEPMALNVSRQTTLMAQLMPIVELSPCFSQLLTTLALTRVLPELMSCVYRACSTLQRVDSASHGLTMQSRRAMQQSKSIRRLPRDGFVEVKHVARLVSMTQQKRTSCRLASSRRLLAKSETSTKSANRLQPPRGRACSKRVPRVDSKGDGDSCLAANFELFGGDVPSLTSEAIVQSVPTTLTTL
mmetsp:Transcript_30662/g.93823  ORF Transcript_30662/g.93823 Transcript_30662/m.93823 type:complete len:225 (+) Transcript_30662:586-1260(+)